MLVEVFPGTFEHLDEERDVFMVEIHAHASPLTVLLVGSLQVDTAVGSTVTLIFENSGTDTAWKLLSEYWFDGWFCGVGIGHVVIPFTWLISDCELPQPDGEQLKPVIGGSEAKLQESKLGEPLGVPILFLQLPTTGLARREDGCGCLLLEFVYRKRWQRDG